MKWTKTNERENHTYWETTKGEEKFTIERYVNRHGAKFFYIWIDDCDIIGKADSFAEAKKIALNY